MKLYLLSQEVNNGYDTYDSAIVAAKNEDEARQIQPSDYLRDFPGERLSEWARPEDVKVKLIGTAVKGTKSGVVLASFNAG